MSRHATDENRTGREIALAIFTETHGTLGAQDLLLALTAYKFPLEMIQKGHLTQLLDVVEKITAEKSELAGIVQSLRAEMNDKDGDSLAHRVLVFCKNCEKAGKSADETARLAIGKFDDPGELGLVTQEKPSAEPGGSVQLKMPGGLYVAYDQGASEWEIRTTTLFPI